MTWERFADWCFADKHRIIFWFLKLLAVPAIYLVYQMFRIEYDVNRGLTVYTEHLRTLDDLGIFPLLYLVVVWVLWKDLRDAAKYRRFRYGPIYFSDSDFDAFIRYAAKQMWVEGRDFHRGAGTWGKCPKRTQEWKSSWITPVSFAYGGDFMLAKMRF